MDARDDAVEEELIKHMLIFSTKKIIIISTCSYTKNVDCKEVTKEEFEAEKRTRKVKGQRGCNGVI